jgi:hypothetical protein
MDQRGSVLEVVATEKSSVERRGAIRFAAEGRVSCHPAGCRPGEQWVGKVRDVSRTGIGLSMPRRWERGTILILEIEPVGDSGPRSLCACVIHATPQADSNFLVGCAHGGDLTEEELQAFQPGSKPEFSPQQ